MKIASVLAETRNIKIGGQTAERLKNTVGSLLDDDNKMTEVDGRELSSGAPASVTVYSGQIYEVITTSSIFPPPRLTLSPEIIPS